MERKSERQIVRILIGMNMLGDASQVRTADRNQTTDFDPDWFGLKNITDELYPLLDYINVTLLPDVNMTEEIDSFYFYEVSEVFAFFFFRRKLRNSARICVCSCMTFNFRYNCRLRFVKLWREKIGTTNA